MIKQNMKHFNRLFIIIDAFLIGLVLVLAWLIRFKSGLLEVGASYLPFSEYMRPLIVIIPTYLLIYNFFNLYRPHRTKSLFDEFGNLIKANLVGIAVFFIYLYITKNIHYSRILLVMFFGLNITICFYERLMLRTVLRRYRSGNHNLKHIIFVGISDMASEYADRIYRNKHWGYNIQGIFDDHVNRNYISFHRNVVQVLGNYKQLEAYIQEHAIDEVIITLSLKDYSNLEHIVEICEKQGVYTKIIPAYSKVIPSRPYIEDVDGLPVISIRNVPLNDIVNRGVKRAIDIAVSLFGIIVLSPIFLMISLLIKLESRGPVLFKQERIGLNRQGFNMYKFRSMVIQSAKEEKSGWTTKNDPRVTRLGGFLRKTNLDELPQLVNVLKGDMSIIGPRPERPQFVDQFKEEIPKYMVKHQVRPGMTGWAQVHGYRGDTSIKRRIEHDLYYIENWTFKMDVKILLMTFFGKHVNRNAY